MSYYEVRKVESDLEIIRSVSDPGALQTFRQNLLAYTIVHTIATL